MPSSTNALARQRCLRHPAREAAACCPSCGKYFCRECVTEHDDQVLCNSCFQKDRKKNATEKGTRRKTWTLLKFMASFLFLWLAFYSMGRILLSIPSSLHDGAIWTHEDAPSEKP